MKQRAFVHLSLVIYVITMCLLRNSLGGNYFCNNVAMNPSFIGGIDCYYMSQNAVTWHEAHRFCHKRRGWLANNLGRNLGSAHTEYLHKNEVWSGLHVRNHRMMEDAFPFSRKFPSADMCQLGNAINIAGGESICDKLASCPEDDIMRHLFRVVPRKPYNLRLYEPFGSIELQGPYWNHTVTRYKCVVEESIDNSNMETQSNNTKRGGGTRNPTAYQMRFVPCDEEHVFVCYLFVLYPGGANFLRSPGGQLPVITYGGRYMPLHWYLTREPTSHNESDQACGRWLKGGTTFREASGVPLDMLILISKAYNDNGGWSDVSQHPHWVKINDHQCQAAKLDDTLGKGYNLTTTPCDSKLRVICQRDLFDNTALPETSIKAVLSFQMTTTDEVYQVDDEIRGPIETLQDLVENGGFSCHGTNPQDQIMVQFFKSGKPIRNLIDNMDQAARKSLPVLRLSPLGGPCIQCFFLGYYYCQVYELKGNRLLTSNRIFLRPTDITVYSLHIELFSNTTSSRSKMWEYYTSSLDHQLANEVTSELTDILSLKMRIPWHGFPVLFLPEDETHKNRLVFNLWKYLPTSPTNDESEQMEIEYLQTILLTCSNLRKMPFDMDSVRVLSIDWCWPKIVNDNATQRRYALPKTSGGTMFESDETCAQDGRPRVTVECQGDKVIGFEWGPVQSNSSCDYSVVTDGDVSNVTNTLMSISQQDISAMNVDWCLNETKSLLYQLTNETVKARDILYLAVILQKSSKILQISPGTAQDFLDTVRIATSFDTTSLTEAQEVGKATNRMLKSIDTLGGHMAIGDDTNTRRIMSGQYAFEAWNLTRDYQKSPIVGLKVLSDGESDIESNDMVSLFSKDDLEYHRAQAAILLPKPFIMSVLGNNSSEDIKLSLNIYRDTTLYSTVESRNSATLNSKVIAAQLLVEGRQITDISPYKVITVFEPSRQVEDDEIRQARTVCAYWDYTAYEGAGSWATDGCDYERTESGRDVCICDHLTNFAVLLDFYGEQEEDETHKLSLRIITIVGLSLSIFGLSVSILSFLCIKKLRQGRPQQTLFNLALALLLSWIVLLAGLERTENRAGCIAVAAILHYLIMASFMWMLMEAILQYLLFVRVMNTYVSKYMLKTGVSAWGLPIIPVIIVFAIDPDLYRGRENYCWMSLEAFYYAFALPVGLIVLTNLVIFILVVVSLCRRKDMSKSSTSSQSHAAVNLRASFICFSVLGMSWVFGFLTIEKARTAFQYIFCITSTLQGFIIFIMMTARDKNVRQFWKAFFCGNCKTDDKESGCHTSSNKQPDDSPQRNQPIPDLQKVKDVTYDDVDRKSTNTNSDQVTSSTNTSVSDGGKGDHYDLPVGVEANRSEEVIYVNYDDDNLFYLS